MILMAVVDDGGGMAFNGRRQSQDRVQREKMLELSGDRPLFVPPYTARLFEDGQQNRLHVSETYLTDAGPGDYAWTERDGVEAFVPRIEKVILFHWNRTYPADTYFDLDLSSWHLTCAEEFTGSSHAKITREEYTP